MEKGRILYYFPVLPVSGIPISGITSLWYTATIYIDIKYIKDLLGHFSIKTALRYLHVTNKDLVNILSPIEDIKDFL